MMEGYRSLEGSTMSLRTVSIALGAALLLAACSTSPDTSASPGASMGGVQPLPLTVTSNDFIDGGGLAPTYAGCKGDNLNPQLSWSEGPDGTASYAITMRDPDANYEHWLQYDIPIGVTSVARGASSDLAGVHGQNTHHDLDYFGPCPPSQHHYVFTVYALDTTLDAPETLDVASFLHQIEGHVLAQGSITGLYPADPS